MDSIYNGFRMSARVMCFPRPMQPGAQFISTGGNHEKSVVSDISMARGFCGRADRHAHDDEAPVSALQGWRLPVFGAHALALKHGKLALAIKDGKVLTHQLS